MSQNGYRAPTAISESGAGGSRQTVRVGRHARGGGEPVAAGGVPAPGDRTPQRGICRSREPRTKICYRRRGADRTAFPAKQKTVANVRTERLAKRIVLASFLVLTLIGCRPMPTLQNDASSTRTAAPSAVSASNPFARFEYNAQKQTGAIDLSFSVDWNV